MVRKTLSGLIISFAMTANPLWADEKITFDSDEQLQEFFVKTGYKWECKYKDKPPAKGVGTKQYVFDKGITLSKITASITNSFCPGGSGTLKGKYKKGKFTGVLKQSTKPCVDVKGQYVIHKKADSSYYMKGPYNYRWTDGNTYYGSSTCIPE